MLQISTKLIQAVLKQIELMLIGMCTSKNFSNISTESKKSAFVHQIEFDKARWSCSWNSDQNYNKTLLGGLGE